MMEMPVVAAPVRRRRRPRKARLARIDARRAAAALVLVVALMLGGWIVHRARRPDPHAELAASARTYADGNYAAARKHAQTAASVATDAGGRRAADLALARALLATGDGLQAESALDHAAGLGARRVAAVLAEARLIQGDPDGAEDAASHAAAVDRTYAARIVARARALDGDFAGARATLVALIARSPTDADAWRDLGRIRFDTDDLGGAGEATARSLALAPYDPDALTLAGELVRARYGPVAALPWFGAALARDAFYVPALLDRAATLGDTGRSVEALAATRAALAARPGEPRAYYIQAVIAARAGRIGLARSLLARSDGGTPGALLLGGALDAAAGRQEGAIAQFRSLVALQPFNLGARRLLATALLRSGDAKGALDVIRPVAQRADADPYTLTLAGRAWEAQGRRDLAGALLDRAATAATAASVPFGADDVLGALAGAVAADPADPARAVGLVRGLVAAGRIAEARAKAAALAAAGPGAPENWLLLGDVEAGANRPADAAGAYARAAGLRFDEPTMLRLVDADARARRPGEASRALALYAGQNPASTVAARMVARLQLGAGMWEAAATSLGRAAAGTDPLLLAELSTARLGAGDAAAGLRLARAAYRIQPMSAAMALAYARALTANGDGAGARALRAKAAALPR